MADFMRQLLCISPALTLEERNLFCLAFKNVTSKLRNAWRRMEYLERFTSPKPHKQAQMKLIAGEKATIAVQLTQVCEEVLNIAEQKLIPATESAESKVFYLKLAADYARYLAEATADSVQRKSFEEKSFNIYSEAYRLASKLLPSTHVTRLGLALNYSVFFYDIRKSPEGACHLAKDAFDSAIADLDALNEENYKDSVMILQLLRDNLTIWMEEIVAGGDEGNAFDASM